MEASGNFSDILEGRSIFYTDYLFYPNGVHLYFHTLNLPYSILSIPLSYFLELHQIYNMFILIAFILAGFFKYLFLRKLTNSRAMYLQTIHNQKMLDGYISRRENESLYSIVKLKTFIREEDIVGLINFLKEQNTRYIIYYKFLRGEAYSHEFSKILSLLPQKTKRWFIMIQTILL